MIYWFTGQPGSGKTTLAKELVKYLKNDSKDVFHIDGDDIRDIFKNKDYSEKGRRKNIERAQDISKYLNEKGYDVIVSLVSPYKNQRDDFKKDNNLIEIYIHTEDVRGRESYHVVDYEKPTENYVDIDTTSTNLVSSFNELISKLDI